MPPLAADDDEYLEDGANSATPDGDNLVLDFARADVAAYRELLAPLGAEATVDDDLGVVTIDAHSPSPFGNVVMVERPIPESRTAELGTRLHEWFDGTEGGQYIVYSPWPLADLSPYGLARVGHPPLMARPAGPSNIEAPDGVTITEVTDDAALVEFEATLVESYPIDELRPPTPGCFLRPELLGRGWRFFLATDGDGRPLATAGGFVSDTVTVVEVVSTRPEARGRGVGAAVTAAAATADPTRPAMLISSDDGRGVYERLGFLPLLRYSVWIGNR